MAGDDAAERRRIAELEARGTWGERLTIAVSLALAGLAGAWCWVAVGEFRAEREVRLYGETATAVVEDGSWRERVPVAFVTALGEPVHAHVDTHDAYSLAEGDLVEILYDPEAPTRVQFPDLTVDERREAVGYVLGTGWMAVLASLPAALTLLTTRARRRLRRLPAEGGVPVPVAPDGDLAAER